MNEERPYPAVPIAAGAALESSHQVGNIEMTTASYERTEQERGLENMTSISATYKGVTFKLGSLPADVDEWIEISSKTAADLTKEDKGADVRSHARSWVIAMIERNEHTKSDKGSMCMLAGTLLWLACTSPEPMGSYALRRAKEGGATIAYEITGGEKGYRWNFSLVLDGQPGDPNAAIRHAARDLRGAVGPTRD